MQTRIRWTYVEGLNRRLYDVVLNSGLMMQDICKKSGVSVRALDKYLYEGVTPSCSNLVKLCKVLGVSSDYILGLSVTDVTDVTDVTLKK